MHENSAQKKQQFLKEIRDIVLVADGAMGTMLYAKGFSYKSCFDELNVTHPEAVLSIHQAYIKAGAQLIETNTFGANPIRLRDYGLEDKTEEINQAAVGLAKKAWGLINQTPTLKENPPFVPPYNSRGEGRWGLMNQTLTKGWVAGAVGPMNRPMEPIGQLKLEEVRQAFARQIQALVDGGVDAIILETFSNLREITLALTEARKFADTPVIAQMTFSEDGKTIMGDKPSEVVQELERLGADVVGVNCSVGPQGMLEVIEMMAEQTDLPLSAMPNAGFPLLEGGRYIYLTSPAYFADYVKKFVEAGVNIVGGCCGTTPAHIQAVAEAVQGKAPGKRRRTGRITGISDLDQAQDAQGTITEMEAPKKETVPSTFRDMLNRKFVVSVEIDPPKSVDPNRAIQGAMLLRQAGVHVINVADSPLGRARMSALALARLIQQNSGVETVLHLTCRDRNILGLQSELLGAQVLGVRHILAITGDPPSAGDYPFSKGVFDLDSVGLVHLIRRLNEGKDLSGKDLGEPTDFTIGVGVNPTAMDMTTELDKFRRKVEAGAQYAFTQPLFQVDTLQEFMDGIQDIPIPILVGILPLRNAKHAEFLHHEVPEMEVPEEIRKRMHQAGDKGLEEGIAIAREFLETASKLVQGVYIMPPFNRFQVAAEVIRGLVPDGCVPR